MKRNGMKSMMNFENGIILNFGHPIRKLKTMTKWFPKTPKKYQEKLLNFLDKLSQVTDDKEKIRILMVKTKYTEEFCIECVEVWRESNRETQGDLF